MINWLKIRDYAERKHHEQHMRNYKHDRKCEKCSRWYSCTGYAQNVRDVDYVIQTTECASCGHVTEWFMGAMIPVLMSEVRNAEKTGIPINQIVKDTTHADR